MYDQAIERPLHPARLGRSGPPAAHVRPAVRLRARLVPGRPTDRLHPRLGHGRPGDIVVLDPRRVTSSPGVTHSSAYDHQVAWAPAGHRLVFERDFGDRSAIFTIKPDGTELERLTTGAHFDVGPTYSPDAPLIAFGSDRGDVLDDLWVMDSNGADLHALLSWPASPRPSPTGSPSR